MNCCGRTETSEYTALNRMESERPDPLILEILDSFAHHFRTFFSGFAIFYLNPIYNKFSIPFSEILHLLKEKISHSKSFWNISAPSFTLSFLSVRNLAGDKKNNFFLSYIISPFLLIDINIASVENSLFDMKNLSLENQKSLFIF